MRSVINLFRDKETRLENWVVLLIGLWIFLIPFGRGAQFPAAALAAIGLTLLFKTKGRCAASPAAKSFLLLCALYLVPIAISMLDAPSHKYPMRVFWLGVGSALAGIAIIHGAAKRETLERITFVIAMGVAFWLLYAGIQILFGCDLFRESWQGAEGRISGPFKNKNIMGYYAGPYSAILLMFAWQKKWKPVWLALLLAATSVVILRNNSRGGWVMYAIVAIGFVWKAFIAPRKHKLLVSCGIILLGASVITGLYYTSVPFKGRVDQTLEVLKGTEEGVNEALTNRIPIWKTACNAIKAHPINGLGARNFRKVAHIYWPREEYDYPKKVGNTFYPHQLILEYTFGTGFIGLAGLIASGILCICWWFRGSAGQRTLACGYGLVLLADYFPLNTHRSMFASLEALSIWILIALYCATVFFSEENSAER